MPKSRTDRVASGPWLLPKSLAVALRAAARKAGTSQTAIVEAALRTALREKPETSARVIGVLETGPAGALAVALPLREAGETLQGIAEHLNAKGYRTARGRAFDTVATHRLLRVASP